MGIRNFFKKRKTQRSTTQSYAVQTRTNYQHPFGALDKYIPLQVEYELYKNMREAVPILDTAINRIVRLVGTFNIECESEKQEKEISEFLDNVKTNSNQIGIYPFIESYLEQLIECGNTSGEIILNNAKNNIYALKNTDIRTIKLKQTDNPLENLVCQVQPGETEPVVLPYQNLILFTPLDPEGDSPYGVSIFRSMPFMTSILLRIFNSIGTNWERFGNVRYSVVYKPSQDIMDPNKVRERMGIIEEEFSKAMQDGKDGKVRDFVGIGDIEIKVIGADNQVLDSEIPVKQVLEQLVAKTGLPPFLLGLSWSTTERMSQQQADFLTSELDNYRDEVTPVVKHIIDTWQVVTGKNIPYEIVWDDINLQDAVEMARAELLKQQAKEKEINNIIRLRNENIIDQQTVAEELGYDNPVGDAPQPVYFFSEDTREGQEDNKSMNFNKVIKSPFNAPPEDVVQHRIEQDTLKGYMKCVQRLENKVLELIKDDGIVSNYQMKLETFIEDFKKEMIGSGKTDDRYGTYGTYLLHAFSYGAIRADRTIQEEFEEKSLKGARVKPNYNHPYVQELLINGMERVVTKARDKKDDILLIMAEYAQVGDNPIVWARELRRQLKDSITGERWYWERLARSESAMAIDRAEETEYIEQGFNYCQWSAAPDACHICLNLDNGDIWPIQEAPKVVEDTHPHCRCRKLPRTKRQYERWKGNV